MKTDTVNTSYLSKRYRTTTSDIEKKLRGAGVNPFRTVVQESGRRFMLWDRNKALQVLEAKRRARLDALNARALEQDLVTAEGKQPPSEAQEPPEGAHQSRAPAARGKGAMVSELTFLRKMVEQLSQRLTELEKTHQVEEVTG